MTTNKAFYMVYLEGQNGPTYKHETINSAEQEAQRLLRLYGKKAFVLCAIKSFEMKDIYIEVLLPENTDGVVGETAITTHDGESLPW